MRLSAFVMKWPTFQEDCRLVLFCHFHVLDKRTGLRARKWRFQCPKLIPYICKALKMCWVLNYQTTLQERCLICCTYMDMRAPGGKGPSLALQFSVRGPFQQMRMSQESRFPVWLRGREGLDLLPLGLFSISGLLRKPLSSQSQPPGLDLLLWASGGN